MVSYAISELKEVNKSILSKGNRLKPSPIFDCGAGLLSDLQIDYPLNMPIEVCWQRVKAKPFSRPFAKQASFFNATCGEPFSSDVVTLDLSEAAQLYSSDVINRAVQTLSRGLSFYDIALSGTDTLSTSFFK